MGILLITGGIRSGKSKFAIQMAKKISPKDVLFVATYKGNDSQMLLRIKEHKKQRPKSWQTQEEPLEVVKIIKETDKKVIILDCLGIFIFNLIWEKFTYKRIIKEVEELAKEGKKKENLLIVTNEVGLGLVAADNLSRRFQDILGQANQIISKNATEVYFLISSIPIRIK